MKLIVLQFFLMCVVSSFGQINFYKQFSNNGYDYGEGIVQTEDTSYFITGTSSSFTEGPSQAFLLKVDSLGNFLWSKHFGGAESDGGKRVMYIEDEGVLIAGFTNSFGNGAYDFYLTKVDLAGNQLWEETYGTSSWDRVYDAALTKDSGVIMVGETLNTEDGESDILIVRTDKNGAEVWSQQLGGVGADIANCIEKLDDSTFAIGGMTYVEDSLKFKALLFRIQDNNTILWMDTIGPNGNYEIKDLSFELATENISIVGKVTFPNGDIGLIENKSTKNGLLFYENYSNNNSIEYYSGITPIGQSGKFTTVVSFDNQFSYGGLDLGFNQNYNYLGWEAGLAQVNYVYDEYLGQIITSNDFGAVGVGTIINNENGGSNLFIIKIKENGVFFNVNDSLTVNSLVTTTEIKTDNYFKLYPNPASSNLTVQFEKGEIKEVRIYDYIGSLVLSLSLNEGDEISIENLENGVYYFELLNKDGFLLNEEKFVVIH